MTASAQGTLDKGALQLNAGLGFSGWGLPVYVGVDYGIADDFTIGGEVSYRSVSYHTVRYSSLGIVANGNYHFNRIFSLPSEFNLYAGLNIGYYYWSNNYNGSIAFSPHYSSAPNLGLQVGGRYFINKNFGVNLELGGGQIGGAGKLGITYKF